MGGWLTSNFSWPPSPSRSLLPQSTQARHDPERRHELGPDAANGGNSTDDDESDDEATDDQPKLPLKKQAFGGFQRAGASEEENSSGSGHAPTAAQSKSGAGTGPASEEVESLQAEIELLRALLDHGPMVSQAAQVSPARFGSSDSASYAQDEMAMPAI